MHILIHIHSSVFVCDVYDVCITYLITIFPIANLTAHLYFNDFVISI